MRKVREAETLADQAIRFLLGNPKAKNPAFQGFPAERIANTIAYSRRFVLDAEMSAFLADLANAAFLVDANQNDEILERTREMCRLPFKTTWIEYDRIAVFRRSRAEYVVDPDPENMEMYVGKTVVPTLFYQAVPESEMVRREAWLLEQHPQLDTAFRATVFVLLDNNNVQPLPISWAWTVNETVVPWPSIEFKTADLLPPHMHAQFLTGIMGYETPYVRAIYYDQKHGEKLDEKDIEEKMMHWAGDLRYLWALLSTINDLPVTMRPVTPSKGYVAKGRYRKFLNHSIVHLKVPAKYDARKLARKLVALSRKRAHQVRGHWRTYRLSQKKVWIKEHQRGDASLGFVTHDYTVEKGDHRRTP